MNNNNTEATVIQFPQSKIIRINPSPDPTERQKFSDKVEADAITANIMTGFVLDTLSQMHGIDVEDPDFQKYFSFATAIFHAALFKFFELEHPLHKFVDENIKVFEKLDIPEPTENMVDAYLTPKETGNTTNTSD